MAGSPASHAIRVARPTVHPVARFVARRLAAGVLTLLVLSIVIFAATNALPGDAAEVALGKSATPERLAELRHELDLDRPLPERYVAWIGGVATGDLGT